jgi:hypothetical protein
VTVVPPGLWTSRACSITTNSQIILTNDSGLTRQYGVGVLSLEADTQGVVAVATARWWNFFMIALYEIALLFSQHAVSMQFLFRYYALCL